MLQIVLKVTSGPHEGRQFSFDSHDNFIVGRAKSAQFRLSKKDQYFSRNHFLVEVNPPLCRLLDLNSMNGTFVNGKKVASTELHDGDTIKAGETTLQVSVISGADQVTPAAAVADDGQPAVLPSVTPHVANDQTFVPRDWPRELPDAAKEKTRPGDHGPDQPGSQHAEIAVREPSKEAPSNPSPPVAVVQPEVSATDRAKIDAQPQPFDRYELIEEIGRGGMGIVYRARDRQDGTMVALKVVSPAVAASPEDLARFVREAGIVKKLSHPHIVPYRDLGHAQGRLYFAMKLVAGMDGHTLLRRHNGPLPVARAVAIVCQLLEALSEAHQAGYVHRDVKPSNLLIEQQAAGDFVWLADFGLARTYHSSTLSGLTTTGDIGGTLPFMAPEQITDYRNVTPAADQYSAAATLYYLLTRSYIYDFPTDMASKLLMVLQEPPRLIQHRCPEIPERLSAVIHKGLARLPAQRFADVAHFRTALQLCLRKHG